VIRGAFDQPITVQRATAVTDDYGGETLTWADLEKALARVRYGPASEKREAAQVGGAQTATFEVFPTPTLLGTRVTDRIVFDGSDWDISEVAPLDRRTLRFTATRSV
jgi:head-tail adaptor